MGYTIAQKIIKAHLVSGEMTPGAEIGLRIDQTLTQDATGTMAYLASGGHGRAARASTELSVAYIDHNTLQCGFENADDHRFIQTVARKYGVRFSRPGNGICHQVHLERFGKPGKTLIGSDSHTPTGGAHGHAGHGRGRHGRGRGHGRRRLLHQHAAHVQGQPHRQAAPVGQRQGYKPRDAAASSPCKRRPRARSSNGAARASKRSPSPSAPPSPTWAPSWARPRPSSPPTR